MNERMSHFDEMTCLLYVDGQLEASAAAEVRAHSTACESCGALLRALRAESLGLTSALIEADEAFPARLAEFEPAREVERASAARWAWLLTFGVGGAAAYIVWASLIQPLWDSFTQAGLGGTTVITTLVFNGAFWKGWNSMIDSVQTAALVALGIFAFSLVPLKLRRGAAIAMALGGIALLAGLPAPAGAAEIQKTQSYTLEKDQVVHDDLIVTGERVEINGTVDGDLIVFARNVTVHGHVTGDILGFAQFLTVDGTVDDNIRAFANTLTLDGTVGKNVTIAAQSVDISSDAKIGGTLTTGAGDALIDGTLGRGYLGFDAQTEIEGSIGGNTEIYGKQLSIASTAQLNGTIDYTGPEAPEVADGARLASPVHFVQRRRERRASSAASVVHAILRYGAALLAGLLLITILPGFFDAGLRTARRWPVALGVGGLTMIIWFFLVIAGIVLVFAGVGAGLAAAVLYFPIAYLAQIFVGAWLGDKMMPTGAATTGARWGRLALGLLVIYAVGVVPILGGLEWFAVVLWGTGAVLLAIYEQSRRPAAVAAVA